MKKNSWLVWGLLVMGLLLGVTGCKTSQVAQQRSMVSQDSLQWAQDYHQNVQSIQARYVLGFKGNQILNLKGELSAVLDQELLVSIKALFGFEILQLYCTPTQAVIVDKIRQRYCSIPFVQLAPELGVDFYGLQGLLTQGLFDPSGKFFVDFKVKKEGENLVYSHRGKYQTEFILNSIPLLQRTQIADFEKGSSLLVQYTNPEVFQGIGWNQQMQVFFTSKTVNQSVELKFSQVKINQSSKIKWSLPSHFQEVPLMNIKRELNGL